ncbi:HNH endonuclease [Bacillus sp. EAC]|uniref:HNH endonuclease n=1 Tax=Bacillus sp. EAC TaxID=1978338 RepID=UPI00211ADF2F|nr:HNH endonuclease [Bacillus sp. EAC]
MCQVCIRERNNTQLKYNYINIEVHHIESVANDWNKRLDDDNLICLCSYHHKMSEGGEISKDELSSIVQDQQARFKLS